MTTQDEAARDQVDTLLSDYFDAERGHAFSPRDWLSRRIRSYGDTRAREAAEAMRQAASDALLNGNFLHAEDPAAKWARQVSALILALPLPAAEAPAREAGGNADDPAAKSAMERLLLDRLGLREKVMARDVDGVLRLMIAMLDTYGAAVAKAAAPPQPKQEGA